jgi:hypothetical protein
MRKGLAAMLGVIAIGIGLAQTTVAPNTTVAKNSTVASVLAPVVVGTPVVCASTSSGTTAQCPASFTSSCPTPSRCAIVVFLSVMGTVSSPHCQDSNSNNFSYSGTLATNGTGLRLQPFILYPESAYTLGTWFQCTLGTTKANSIAVIELSGLHATSGAVVASPPNPTNSGSGTAMSNAPTSSQINDAMLTAFDWNASYTVSSSSGGTILVTNNASFTNGGSLSVMLSNSTSSGQALSPSEVVGNSTTWAAASSELYP